MSKTAAITRVRSGEEAEDKLTDMNVPGRKNRVTNVMIRIVTVSCLVFCAMSCMLFVIDSMFFED
jgi:hypothetical protein